MQKIRFFLISAILFTAGFFNSCGKNNYEVMVVGVNTENFNEIDILVNALENKKAERIGGVNLYSGKISNKNVAIVEAPVGMGDSAMATTIGINRFHPKNVISEGTSGGHHDDVHINDILLAQNIIDTSSYRGDGSDPSSWELMQPTLHSDETLLKIARNVPNEYGALRKNGTIASGNCWNKGVDFINKLHEKFNEDCEEMECYSVTNVCGYHSIPALSIKVISNNLITDEEYTQEAGKNIQRYVLNVIKAI